MLLGIDKVIEDFKGWSFMEYLWMFIVISSGIGLSLYWGDTTIGMISMVTNILCVVLVAKGRISSYFWGLIGVVTYAYVSYQSKIYGDVMLNVIYFFPMQFVGYYLWKKNMGNTEVEKKYLTLKQKLYGVLVCAVSIYAWSLMLKMLGGNVPVLDATSTVLSIIAMALLSFGYAEQWTLWIIVNLVSISMWVSVAMIGEGSVAMLVMWVTFLLNSIFGYIKWKRT